MNSEEYLRKIGYTSSMNQRLLTLALDALSLDSNDRFLDIGCGIGDLVDVASKICSFSIGIDYVNEFVEHARKLGRNVIRSDILEFDTNLKFTKISAIGVLHYIDKLHESDLYNKLYNLLEPGGLLVIRTKRTQNIIGDIILKFYHFMRGSKWNPHTVYHSEEYFRKVFRGKFKILRMYVEPYTGKYPKFLVYPIWYFVAPLWVIAERI